VDGVAGGGGFGRRVFVPIVVVGGVGGGCHCDFRMLEE
jgi:hypothetical protein